MASLALRSLAFVVGVLLVVVLIGGLARAQSAGGPYVVAYPGAGNFSGSLMRPTLNNLKRVSGAEVVISGSSEGARKAARNGRRVVAIGHSLGGPAAVGLAENISPLKVHAIILMDSIPTRSSKPSNVNRCISFPFVWGTVPRGCRKIRVSSHIRLPSDEEVIKETTKAVCGK